MSKDKDTMTDLLRKCLRAEPSVRAVARETGLNHAALLRFNRGEQSLRLDLADKLAAHFGIESRIVRRKGQH